MSKRKHIPWFWDCPECGHRHEIPFEDKHQAIQNEEFELFRMECDKCCWGDQGFAGWIGELGPLLPREFVDADVARNEWDKRGYIKEEMNP